jgi:hypothetical protein
MMTDMATKVRRPELPGASIQGSIRLVRLFDDLVAFLLGQVLGASIVTTSVFSADDSRPWATIGIVKVFTGMSGLGVDGDVFRFSGVFHLQHPVTDEAGEPRLTVWLGSHFIPLVEARVFRTRGSSG